MPPRPARPTARGPTATCRSRPARATARGWRPSARWPRGHHTPERRPSSSRSASTPPPATRRARWPSPPTASAKPAARSARSACRPSSSRRAATTWPRSARWWRRRSPACRKERRVPDSDALERIWIGKDERAGIPVPERVDVPPPPHWRLEAIAHTARPRSLSLSADGRRAVFIEDRDTSDLYAVDLEAEDAAPERLTAGRELQAFWEDTHPRISPDGATVAYGDAGHVWLVPTTGGVPRKLVEGGGPVWLDDLRLIVAVEHEIETTRTPRLTVVDVADPFPRRLVTDHAGLEAAGDEEEPA